MTTFCLEPCPEYYTFADKTNRRKFWLGASFDVDLPEDTRVAYVTHRWGLRCVDDEPYFVFILCDENIKILGYKEITIRKVEFHFDTKQRQYLEVKQQNIKKKNVKKLQKSRKYAKNGF
jgi:hypothetical protein